MSQSNEFSQSPAVPQYRSSHTDSFNLSEIDLEQTFRLIDSLVPFKPCSYHQMIPLSLADSCLTLGMVNPEDSLALDYINPILKSLNCSLKAQKIDTKTHQLVSSAYLNYSRRDQPAEEIKSPKQKDKKRLPKSANERTTFIVDRPEELISQESQSQPSDSPVLPQPSKNNLSPELSHLSSEDIPQHSSINKSKNNIHNSLGLQPHYLSAPLEFLSTLTPQQLWRELLGRVVIGGIGRLYFERHSNHGCILLSQNGVIKSSLNELKPSLFQDVLNEFKNLVHLPSIPVRKPKKVEMGHYYQQERLLLRLQIKPGKYGEEGTLQVLKGKALNFYQQKQMDQLGEQALHIAQQLEQKLRQIQIRTRINPSQLSNLSEIHQIQARINRQLKSLDDR